MHVGNGRPIILRTLVAAAPKHMPAQTLKEWPAAAPAAYHVLAKPSGAICNLDCEYCFFLAKKDLNPDSRYRMSDDLLGIIQEERTLDLVASDRQRQFGNAKRDTLPRYCRESPVLFACHGECPKNRFIATPDGEPGLNYLCAGYKAFFTHSDRPMRLMGQLLRRDRAPADVMAIMAAEDAQLQLQFARTGRNDPYPSGSGRKFKQCHGRNGPARAPTSAATR